MGRMGLRKIHGYETNNMDMVELIKGCPKRAELYTVAHGEALLGHFEGNGHLLGTAENPEKWNIWGIKAG